MVPQSMTQGQPMIQSPCPPSSQSVIVKKEQQPSQILEQTLKDGGVKLDEFLKYQPPSFSGTNENDDPEIFIEQTQRLCRVLHSPSWRSVELASFRLQGVALAWFNRVLAERSTKQSCLEWEEFKALFLDRFLPESVRDARAREFEMLMQDGMTVTEYANKFTILSAYAPHHVANESTRIKRFIMGLRYDIFRSVGSTQFTSLSKAIDTARIIEDREVLEWTKHDQSKRRRVNAQIES